jgi:hypothetical protein
VSRGRLTYANVVSTIGVFLLLAGGTAIAAKGLAKNSVGPKQLKSNAVTTAKIKKGAVTKAKLGKNAVTAEALADGSVTGAKLADGSVTGTKIAAGSTNFSQRIARLTRNEVVPLSGVFPLGTFTQTAGQAIQMMGSLEVEFSAACTQPRSAQILLLVDAKIPFPGDIAGFAIISDEGVGAVRRRARIAAYPVGGAGLYRTASAQSKEHSVALYLGASCNVDGPVNLVGSQIDVLGVK